VTLKLSCRLFVRSSGRRLNKLFFLSLFNKPWASLSKEGSSIRKSSLNANVFRAYSRELDMFRGRRDHYPTLAETRARREKWDRWYLGMVAYVATASKDPSTKVGAVIVRPDLTVAAVGYNGFPRGMSDDPALYADRPTKYSRIVHGEMNAILNAHGAVDGCTLYVPFPPCDRCAVHVVQAGIKRVVYEEPSEDIKSRWSEQFKQTAAIFEDAGMEVTVLGGEEVSSSRLRSSSGRCSRRFASLAKLL
jgi:dCMP deaminase